MSLINQMLKDLEGRRAKKDTAHQQDPSSGLSSIEETPKPKFKLNKRLLMHAVILTIFVIIMAGLLFTDAEEALQETQTEKAIEQHALSAEQRAQATDKHAEAVLHQKEAGVPAMEDAAEDPFVALIQAETTAASGVNEQGIPSTQWIDQAGTPEMNPMDESDLMVQAPAKPSEFQQASLPAKLTTLERVQVGDVTNQKQTVTFVFSNNFKHEFYTAEEGKKIGLILDHVKFERNSLPDLKANSLIKEISLQKNKTSLEFVFDLIDGVVLSGLETSKNTPIPQLILKLKETVTADENNQALFQKRDEEPVIKEKKSGEMSRVLKPPTQEELADLRYQAALRDIKSGQMVAAIEKLNFLLSDYPNHQEARKSLAMVYLNRENFVDAEMVLIEGLAYSPQYVPFIVLQARLKIQQGNILGALELLRQHKPNLKEYPDYYAMLASLEQQIGNQEDAGKHYLELLKVDQHVGSWWFGYALSLEATNQRNLAIQAYRRAINTGNLSPDLMAYAQARMQVLGG